MNEPFSKLRGVDQLPLFPLPIVLFPGAPLPLHIFEARYRKMLQDVRASNNIFGISYMEADSGQSRPPVGHVGCVAEVVEVHPLPDGRSNILTVGLIRYWIEEYIESNQPYLIARVRFFEDEEEDAEALQRSAHEVTELFLRIARAVRILNDESARELTELPETDPERLSFLIASAIDLEGSAKQELLELRSTLERLERLRDMLAQAVRNYEERARIHSVAKRNGHGGKQLDYEE
ncbi:LON peptidase substrate-binding domain-containing protein [Pyrinomonas sp.]|uniref:LON peptidase substrate-binding domain-containing protein n=1 Tax=Pyrinomonas sp. TaxID=2080306 RepID=UPI00331AF142